MRNPIGGFLVLGLGLLGNHCPVALAGPGESLGSTAPPVMPAKVSGLGGGYKAAKWGMPLEEVREVLSLNSPPSGTYVRTGSRGPGFSGAFKDRTREDSFLLLTIPAEDEDRIFWFYQDKFYEMEYRPLSGGDGDEQGVGIVLTGLRKKYGKSRLQKSADPMPLLNHVWDDGSTEIRLSMTDPEFSLKQFGIYPSSTVRVSYSSKGLKTWRDRELTRGNMQRKIRDIQKRGKNLQDKL